MPPSRPWPMVRNSRSFGDRATNIHRTLRSMKITRATMNTVTIPPAITPWTTLPPGDSLGERCAIVAPTATTMPRSVTWARVM